MWSLRAPCIQFGSTFWSNGQVHHEKQPLLSDGDIADEGQHCVFAEARWAVCYDEVMDFAHNPMFLPSIESLIVPLGLLFTTLSHCFTFVLLLLFVFHEI
jgi:hypothetical protein